MFLYLIKTNPQQKGDYGGTSFDKTFIISNVNILEENLRIVVNKHLNIDYYTLYRWAYEKSNPKTDIVNNIEVEKIYINHYKTISHFKEKLSIFNFEKNPVYIFNFEEDYTKTFPECKIDIEEKDMDFLYSEITKEFERIKEKELEEKIKFEKEKLLQLLKETDKETLLSLLSDVLNKK